jgi:hypothetical protein
VPRFDDRVVQGRSWAPHRLGDAHPLAGGLERLGGVFALKCLYLVTRSLDPTGQGKTRWAMRWKPALNAFAITFADRFPAAETY